MLKSTFSGFQRCRWQYGSIFIRLAVIASQVCKILQNSSKIWTYSSPRSSKVGTCESFFFVWIESWIESVVRFVFESNLRIESAVYHTSRNTTCLRDCRRIFNPSVFCNCDEREWCTDYGNPNWVLVYFNSVIKRVKQCCCTLILLPKSTLNANLTTTNRFFTNDDRQRGRFENYESDHQYESNLESDVRFEIESNHEASQVFNPRSSILVSVKSAYATSY